jgi:hypothetical protein
LSGAAAEGALGAVLSSARAEATRNVAQERAARIHEAASVRAPLFFIFIESLFLSRRILLSNVPV